jgi:hypothetical protein
MEASTNDRWLFRGFVAGIFAMGMLAGALGLRFAENRGWAAPPVPDAYQLRSVVERLDLPEDRRLAVRGILADHFEKTRAITKSNQPSYRAVYRESEARLREVLTPEEYREFEGRFAEWLERRRGITKVR